MEGWTESERPRRSAVSTMLATIIGRSGDRKSTVSPVVYSSEKECGASEGQTTANTLCSGLTDSVWRQGLSTEGRGQEEEGGCVRW